jgi:hypothetical protein
LCGGHAHRQPNQLTKEVYYRVEIFWATLDTQLQELDNKFNEKVMDLLSTSATLIPRNRFRSFRASAVCEMIKKYYPADFTQQVYGLEQQLKHFVVDASRDEELNISTLTALCHCVTAFLRQDGTISTISLIDCFTCYSSGFHF